MGQRPRPGPGPGQGQRQGQGQTMMTPPASPSTACAASQVAYDTGDYYHSIAWLEEAVSRFRLSYGSWNPEEERGSLEDALDHLAFSYFMVRPPAPSPAPRGQTMGLGLLTRSPLPSRLETSPTP